MIEITMSTQSHPNKLCTAYTYRLIVPTLIEEHCGVDIPWIKCHGLIMCSSLFAQSLFLLEV